MGWLMVNHTLDAHQPLFSSRGTRFTVPMQVTRTVLASRGNAKDLSVDHKPTDPTEL